MNNLERIYNNVVNITGVEIKNKSRKRDIVYAKKIYCNLAREKGYTFKAIGEFIGLNHATVVWHNNDTPYLLKQDKEFMDNYLKVKEL
mgnify:CR=1 FL=1